MNNEVKTPHMILTRVIENLQQVQDACYYGRWQEARDVLCFTIHIQDDLLDDVEQNVDRLRGDKVVSNMTAINRIETLTKMVKRNYK